MPSLLLCSGLAAVLALALCHSCLAVDNFDAYFRVRKAVPTPRVTSVTPFEGHFKGGTTLSIWGGGFIDSPQLACGFMEWDPTLKIRATSYLSTVATFVHTSLITCKTPTNFASATFTPCTTGAGDECDVKIFVTNGDEWSSFPHDFNSGTAVDFKWRNSQPSGAFDIVASNLTGPIAGGTEVSITVDSTAGVNFLESANLKCMFFPVASGPGGIVSAEWLGYIEHPTKTAIRCKSPAFSGAPASFTLKVANFDSGDESGFVTTGSTFTYVANNAHHSATANTDWELTANHPTIELGGGTTISGSLDYGTVRGPLFGGTDVTIKGDAFHPSNHAYCAFIEPIELCATDTDCAHGWSCCTLDTGDNTKDRCCVKSKAFFSYDDNGNNQYHCIAPPHTGITGKDNAYFPIQPGFKAEVRVTLADTIPTDSVIDPTTKFYYPLNNDKTFYFYTDIYVATDGNDVTGQGTSSNPYRTIQRAMNMALYNQEDNTKATYAGLLYGWGIRGEIGSDRHMNRDQIVVKPGIYRGTGNVNLRPQGKLLDVKPEMWEYDAPWATVIDCENSGATFLIQNAQRYWDNNDSTDRETVTVRGINIVRCESATGFSLFNPFTMTNVPYNNPIKSLAGESHIEPRVMTNRPGRSTPGRAAPSPT